MFARLLLNRLLEDICQAVISDVQSCFRSCIDTIDMIFSVRPILEKCLEQLVLLYQFLLDLTTAFDTVDCEAPWVILRKASHCPIFVNLIKHL